MKEDCAKRLFIQTYADLTSLYAPSAFTEARIWENISVHQGISCPWEHQRKKCRITPTPRKEYIIRLISPSHPSMNIVYNFTEKRKIIKYSLESLNISLNLMILLWFPGICKCNTGFKYRRLYLTIFLKISFIQYT